MKKFVVPIIIAAALGVGGGAAAVIINRPAVADKPTVAPKVQTGNYYLNGDKNSDVYFEVTDNFIALRIIGDSLEKFKEVMKPTCEGFTEEELTDNAKEIRDDYCAENPYVVSIFGTEKIPYQIMIHWNKENSGPAYGGTGFDYNGVDKIFCAPFGDFFLIK